MRSLIAVTFLGLILTGCSGETPAQTAFLSAEASDTAALSALVVYEKTPNANQAVISKLLADQSIVDQALSPEEAEVNAGQPVTASTELQTAVATFVADEATNQVSK